MFDDTLPEAIATMIDVGDRAQRNALLAARWREQFDDAESFFCRPAHASTRELLEQGIAHIESLRPLVLRAEKAARHWAATRDEIADELSRPLSDVGIDPAILSTRAEWPQKKAWLCSAHAGLAGGGILQ